MKSMQKILPLLLVAALLLPGCGTGGEEDAVSVESVADITGAGYLGLSNRYAGLVVSGETQTIRRDPNKTIGELLVEEGDTVRAGQVLFHYDLQSLQFTLEKQQLELEVLQGTIAAAEAEIADLETQKAKAAAADQLEYTLQIQSLQTDIREAEYNAALKEKEIASTQAAMEDTGVAAEISGRVMSVGSLTADSSDYSDYGSTDDTFITIMDVETCRVQGNVNELNVGELWEGMPVTIRSRTDSDRTWTGAIETIDLENPVQTNHSEYYYDDSDTMTNSSKYPFYIELDDPDGLILGQHVYIELGAGDGEERMGLWLPEYYLASISDSEGVVWAESSRGALEERSVTLGAYDAELGEYEILSGLDTDDWIAFPMEGLEAGMPTEHWSYALWDDYEYEDYEYEDYDFEDYVYEDYEYEDYEYEDYEFEDDDLEDFGFEELPGAELDDGALTDMDGEADYDS